MKLVTASALALLIQTGYPSDLRIASPDKRMTATLIVGRTLSLRVNDGPTLLLEIDSLALAIRGEQPFGWNAEIVRTERRAVDTLIHPPVREKRAALVDRFNQLSVTFSGGYGLVLRAYDDGIAYRLVTALPRDIVVDYETFALRFLDSARLSYQFSKEFWSAYEYPYQTTRVTEIPTEGQCSLPLFVDPPDGPRILVTEAHIQDYPGLWLKHAPTGTLRPTFPGYPLEFLDEGNTYTRGKVTKYASEIARTRGTREYPWRVFVIARTDGDLLTNSLVYLLGEPSRLADISWVKPGVVTLDWWARRNLFGVDFPGGINTATARYIIDFAAHYGLEYVLLDEGWTKDEDLLKINPDLNIDEVVSHAREKGVHILLWAVWSTLERQWDAAFEQFSRWGVSGIKVDFMNRDDQQMVNFYYRVAEETAKRKMLAIFHGAYKPDGLRRTYPNVITREGLIEFEQNQVNLTDSPEYHTLLPFIRMVAGPADYLPGTVNNAQKNEFQMVVQRPMGQGTRAHSMALCVVLESPLRMLPDAPSDYYREDACTRFMAEIPVEWDDIRVLAARKGDYVMVARRHGEEWFVGAVTDWEPRDMEIDFSFLDKETSYTLTAFQDGINADRRAIDYKMTSSPVSRKDRIRVHLAGGGGWVGRLAQTH